MTRTHDTLSQSDSQASDARADPIKRTGEDATAAVSDYLEAEFGDESVIESFGPLARQAPAVLEKYIELRGAVVNSDRPGGLDLRTKELIILAITCMGRKTNPPPLLHVTKAMDAGATVQEIADVVSLCIVVGGMITYQSTGRFILEAAEDYERQHAGDALR